ncbi:MAG: hypothetical protein AAF367_00940 [Pseudomonadota bacterium]
MIKTLAASALAITLLVPGIQAGEAEIVRASAVNTGSGWTFEVTLLHDDTGWEHYADAWRVVGEDGTIYGERVLLHPHETEQPFTRSLSGVSIPDDVTTVSIEAKDNVHGWATTKYKIELIP